MRDMYDYTRDIVQTFMKNPKEYIFGLLFIGLVFYLFYISLWVFCPC